MKISVTWTPTGMTHPTSFVLADSPDPIPMTDFRISGQGNIQEIFRTRAQERLFKCRGNEKTVVTFNATRSHQDEVSAALCLAMHETKLPGQFLATFQSGSGTNRGAPSYLVDAVITAVSSRASGFTTHHSYRIEGAIMVQTLPR